MLTPVPTAVPPSSSSPSRGSAECSRSIPRRTCVPYPWNSWPSVTGVASIRCVRPALTTLSNSVPLASSVDIRWASAGMRSCTTASVAATWIDDGNTSLDDWDALTSSFGCTVRPSSQREASVAMTSLAFMFDDVPEPVWNVSMGKWSRCRPSTISRAASTMAPATSSSITPNSALTAAAAALMRANARMWAGSRPRPDTGKFSTARWVWARQSASAGTRTSPIVSRSILNGSAVSVTRSILPRGCDRRRRYTPPPPATPRRPRPAGGRPWCGPDRRRAGTGWRPRRSSRAPRRRPRTVAAAAVRPAPGVPLPDQGVPGDVPQHHQKHQSTEQVQRGLRGRARDLEGVEGEMARPARERRRRGDEPPVRVARQRAVRAQRQPRRRQVSGDHRGGEPQQPGDGQCHR